LPGKIEVKARINLQLTGKISLMLDSNSSMLLEYGCYCWHYEPRLSIVIF